MVVVVVPSRGQIMQSFHDWEKERLTASHSGLRVCLLGIQILGSEVVVGLAGGFFLSRGV